MRGRWAAGIVPRNFCWIITEHLAVSERPGGYAPNHRKVRRQEELLWLRAQGFTRIVSLLGSTHNLHAYDELGLEWSRFAMPAGAETHEVLIELYPAMFTWLKSGERLLLHQEELGDRLMGVVAGYLLWSGLLPDGPRAITAVERLLRRQMGSVGRMIVAAVSEIPPPPASAVPTPPHPPAAKVAAGGDVPAPVAKPAAAKTSPAPPAKVPPAKAAPAKAPAKAAPAPAAKSETPKAPATTHKPPAPAAKSPAASKAAGAKVAPPKATPAAKPPAKPGAQPKATLSKATPAAKGGSASAERAARSHKG